MDRSNVKNYMKIFLQLSFGVFCLFTLSCTGSKEFEEVTSEDGLNWLPFDQELFEQAKSEKKLVLLDVGANWCHWCHVMDDSTYDDPEVKAFLQSNFVLSKEDQDSRPDLYAAYRSHGWPATVVFNSEGEELLKLRGYQYRTKFIRQLQAVIDQPTPLAENREASELAGEMEVDALTRRYIRSLNHEIGGYPSSKMQLHREGLEFGLKYGYRDSALAAWTEKTFEASLALVDPVWEGVSQYSDSWKWTNPHYEKLLKVQANYISAYARYGAVKNHNEAITYAEKIYSYCDRFLSSNSVLFNNSQNADLVEGVHAGDYYELGDAARLKKGIPSVDKHAYLKENAMMIQSLIHLWAATSNDSYLQRAVAMEKELEMNNRLGNRWLFVREKGQEKILSFEDNRWFLVALMELYQSTGEERYQEAAIQLCDEIWREFNTTHGLMVAHTGAVMTTSQPVVLDNINFCKDLSFLYAATGNKKYKERAQQLMDHLTIEAKEKVWYLPYTIEARNRLNTEPFHAVWLYTEKRTELEIELVQKLLLVKDNYLLIERKNLNKLPEKDQLFYGGMEPNTLLMCTSSYCSAPIQSVAEVERFFEDADRLLP